MNLYGSWNVSMLADEDLAQDICLYLQQLRKFITAEKLMLYLHCPDVKLKHGIDCDISIHTARHYLYSLGYRFTYQPRGQYVDGHERADVIYHRDKVYLPHLLEHLKCAYHYNNDGTLVQDTTLPPRHTIIWYHDESIFYAHDRRRKIWYYKDADIPPQKKGEGVSFIVADYFSSDYGWL
jgi:hypothetical protein